LVKKSEEREKKKREIDDKISIFGILSATKALTNPIKEIAETNRQILETQKRIESSLSLIASSQKAVAQFISRIAYATERANTIRG